MGGAFGNALNSLARINYKLGNIVQERLFNPFRDGAGLGKTYAERSKQYGSIL
jgi:hypothetical protein